MQLNKIHLACGNNIFNNWKNYDYHPNNGASHIDLLQKLPFEDNTVDFIYFEHALEHFDEIDGYRLLQEFYRVLKLSGVVRIVTPSIDTYIKRYLDWFSPINSLHIEKFDDETQFINYAFFGENITNNIKFLNGMQSQEIGHKFIYSKNNLSKKLQKIGFNYEICSYNDSKYDCFKNIETRPNYEDLIFEATK